MRPHQGAIPFRFVTTVVATSLILGACSSSSPTVAPTTPPTTGPTTAAATPSPSTASSKVYNIVLSNNFAGNEWRTEMQNIAVAMAKNNAPYAGHVNLTVQVASGDATAQINSLNNIISQKPDAILMDAASPDALNPTVQKACDAGIVVVSMDQTVTNTCAYRLGEDFSVILKANANWLFKTMGGSGNVVEDLGLAGNPVSIIGTAAFKSAMADNPGIKVVATFEGNYAPGPSQQAMGPILAANQSIGGIYNFAGADGIVQAFQAAHRPLVPMCNLGDMSVLMINLVKANMSNGLQFQFAAATPATSGFGLDLAWRVLNGQPALNAAWGEVQGADPKAILLPLVVYNTNGIQSPGVTVKPASDLFPLVAGLNQDVQLPFSIDQSPVTAAQALGQ